MAENNAVVWVYDPHPETEATIKALQRSGFDINKLSIVGKDYHIAGHVIGYYNAGDRMKVWCQLADFWAAYRACCSDRPSFLSPASAPSKCLARWSVGLSGRWKVLSWPAG